MDYANVYLNYVAYRQIARPQVWRRQMKKINIFFIIFWFDNGNFRKKKLFPDSLDEYLLSVMEYDRSR